MTSRRHDGSKSEFARLQRVLHSLVRVQLAVGGRAAMSDWDVQP
jgi:hypothetical protein